MSFIFLNFGIDKIFRVFLIQAVVFIAFMFALNLEFLFEDSIALVLPIATLGILFLFILIVDDLHPTHDLHNLKFGYSKSSAFPELRAICLTIQLYFFLIYLFAYFYMICLGLLGPENGFNIKNLKYSDFIYFSAVSVTTLGYGDMYPISSILKTIAALQGILGVLFITFSIVLLLRTVTRLFDLTASIDKLIDEYIYELRSRYFFTEKFGAMHRQAMSQEFEDLSRAGDSNDQQS